MYLWKQRQILFYISYDDTFQNLHSPNKPIVTLYFNISNENDGHSSDLTDMYKIIDIKTCLRAQFGIQLSLFTSEKQSESSIKHGDFFQVDIISYFMVNISSLIPSPSSSSDID